MYHNDVIVPLVTYWAVYSGLSVANKLINKKIHEKLEIHLCVCQFSKCFIV